MIQIGEFTIGPCAHGGLWLSRDGGEGMQITGETLSRLEDALSAFWQVYF